jgi:hypothetical protein
MEHIMRALYDQSGEVKTWLRDDDKWLVDLHGNARAYVNDGSVYDLRGRHSAWWRGDLMQDHLGNVIFVTHDVQHLFMMLKPLLHLRPLPPTQKIMPLRPTLGLRPIEHQPSGRWGDSKAFLDVLQSSAGLA